MKRYNDETERPNEWLARLREEPRLYSLLLDEAGSLALAAHRIARARCRIHPTAGAVPTDVEVHAAAREIQSFVSSIARVPLADDLASDCDAAGVPVLARCRAA
jgi:hypothetical protein